MRQQRPDAGCPGLETLETKKGIEPDDAMGKAMQPPGLAAQFAGIVAIQPVGEQQHLRIAGQQPARPVPVEVGQAAGQLGDETNNPHDRPVLVASLGGAGSLSNVAEVHADLLHACARINTGRVAC